jgi:predicted PurR-regulated permease PerM
MPPASNFTRAFVLLASAGIILWLLSWLQSVLVPVALAILLTFLLSPLVRVLQRTWLPRAGAVALVVLVAFSLIGSVGWLIAQQVTSLVETLPQYEHNLAAKLSTLQAGEVSFIDKVQRAVQRVTPRVSKRSAPASVPGQEREKDPLPVRVVSDEGPFQLGKLWAVVGPTLQPIATVGLAIVLVIFMLIRREDLRDRMISLVGHGRVTFTTKALDEATERISRYLFVQLIVNGTYGIAVATGLFFIGVPYAPLWGFFAAVLRYIPYVGSWLAALVPVGLSLLVSDSWTPPLLVVGLFLTLELITNMLVEPWLYGRGIGVSATATLVMIAFWTWLWGPVGLILATPLTVCLAVLGKYVPALKFLDTLLGDQRALEIHVSYYQRLLAGDQDEAADIAEDHLRVNALGQTYDTVLIPALTCVKRDREREALTKDDQQFVVSATRDLVEELATLRAAKELEESPAGETAETTTERISVFGCPARDESDEVALRMFKQLLDPVGYDVVLSSAALLASEVIALVSETRPALVCIAAVPPGGVARTRWLCLRLRARIPELKILVGRWGATGNVEKVRAQLLEAGADDFATTLAETCDQVAALRTLGALPETASRVSPVRKAVGAITVQPE